MSNGLTNSVLNFFGLLKIVVVVAVIVVLIVVFIGVPLPVSGSSMEPNFHNTEVVLIQRLNLAGPVKRGEVVEAKFPGDPNHTKLIKRVIGLPGETVSFDALGHITINGKTLPEAYHPVYGELIATTVNNVKLGNEQYFLVGDNRPGSSDSRIWGSVEQSDIQGRIVGVIWPLNKLSSAATATY